MAQKRHPIDGQLLPRDGRTRTSLTRFKPHITDMRKAIKTKNFHGFRKVRVISNGHEGWAKA